MRKSIGQIPSPAISVFKGSSLKEYIDRFSALLPRSKVGANILRRLSKISLWVTIILIPFRFRYILQSRPFPPLYKDYTDFLIFASDIFLISTLVFWIFSWLLNPRKIRWGPSFVSIPLGAVTLMAVLSSISAVDPALSFYNSVRFILLFGLFLYIQNEITSFRALLIPVAIQVALQAWIGIGQVLDQRSLGLIALGELALDPEWKGVSIVWAEGIRSLRAYGLTDHPNILGGCLAFGLVFITAGVLKPENKWRLILSAVFALGALGLLLTFSRSAWLAFAGGIFLVFVLLLSRSFERVIQLTTLILGTVILIAPAIWQNAHYLGVRLNVGGSYRTVAYEVQAIGERRLLFDAANQIFVENALLGVGIGGLPVAMSQEFSDFPVNYQPAHFVLLDVAAETGLLGASMYFILLIAPWIAMIANRRRLRPSLGLIIAIGLLFSSTLVGMLDYYTWLLTPGRLWQWLIWGLWSLAYVSSFKEGFHD